MASGFVTTAKTTERAKSMGFLRGSFDKIINGAQSSGGKLLALVKRSKGRTKNLPVPEGNGIDNAVDMANKTPEQFTRQLGDLTDASTSAKRSSGAAPDSGIVKNASGQIDSAATIAKQDSILARTGLTKTQVIAGITVSGIIAYAGIVVSSTDGVTATITSIEIDATKNFATITYLQPNDIFAPCVNDTINLSQNCGLGTTSFDITEVVSDTSIKIDISSIASKPDPGVYCPSSPCPSGRSFVCHSDFGNQFDSAVGDFVSNITDAIGAAVGAAVDSAGKVIDRAVTDLTPAVNNLANTAAGAAGGVVKAGFCGALPILCNSTVWLVILLAAIGMIIFVAVS